MIRLVRQPNGSSLCGQACVAMVANITLEESIRRFGSRGGTYTRQLVEVLRDLGIETEDRLTRVTKSVRPADPSIVKISGDADWRKTRWTHWTVYHGGRFYDPSWGIVDGYPKDIKMLSFLKVVL